MNNEFDMPVEYANARDDMSKASASIVIARRKQSRVLAWEWANTAARHCERIGIGNARDLLGTNDYPNLSALDAALASLRKNELVIVTRHKGLVDWLKGRGYDGIVLDRVTPSDILNKHVIGKLPYHLAAITASITNVSVRAPSGKEAEELSAVDMDKYGAFLRTYVVREVTVIEP